MGASTSPNVADKVLVVTALETEQGDGELGYQARFFTQFTNGCLQPRLAILDATTGQEQFLPVPFQGYQNTGFGFNQRCASVSHSGRLLLFGCWVLSSGFG